MPEIDLAAAVRAVEEQNQSPPDPELSAPEYESAIPDTSMDQHQNLVDQPTEATAPTFLTPQDSEYEGADTLDWDESSDVAGAADGIGSLSVSSKGIGYMGPQSGNALLRKLQSISILYFTHYDDLTPQQSPQPSIPDHVLKSKQFTNQCVEWYFQFYHRAYPILHEGHFRAQLMGMTLFEHVACHN